MKKKKNTRVHWKHQAEKKGEDAIDRWINDYRRSNDSKHIGHPFNFYKHEIDATDMDFKWTITYLVNGPETYIFRYEYWDQFDKETLEVYSKLEKLEGTVDGWARKD